MIDDPNKLQRRGRAPRLIPGMHVADPKRRIIVLVGLLVLLGFIWAMLRGVAGREDMQEMTKEAPPAGRLGDEFERFSGVPSLDRKFLAGVTDATQEEQERWDEEAIAYLITEARQTPAVFAYNRNLLPINRGSVAEIVKDPEPWRFQFVRFRGEIEYMEEVDYADHFAGDEDIGQVHVGRIRIDEEKPPVRVKFITPSRPFWADYNTPDPSPETQIINDGWIRGRGILVKKYLDVGPDGAQVPTLLVVATKILRDYKTLPVKSLDDIPFQIIDDYPELLKSEKTKKLFMKFYPKTLFRLVRWATPRAGDAGAELRGKEGLKPTPMSNPEHVEMLLANPVRYRANYFGGLGALAMTPHYTGPEEMEKDKANDAGIEEYINGWIATDDSRLLMFAAPASLDTGLKKRARVRWAGYFYKVQGYYSRDGVQRMAPFFVLTELVEVKPPEVDYKSELIFAAAFLLGIALLIFIILREDKTKQDYRRLRKRRIET